MILVVVPLCVGGASLFAGWRLREPQSLTAAFGLLSGSLLATFALLAGWRNSLTRRSWWQVKTNRSARRAIDEAVAHVLAATLACLLLATSTVVLANVLIGGPNVPVIRDTPALILTALLVSGSAYLLLTMLVIINLLRDAYKQVNDADEKEALKREREAERSRQDR